MKENNNKNNDLKKEDEFKEFLDENKKQKRKNNKKNDSIKGLLTEDEIKKKNSRKTSLMVSTFVLLLAIGIGGNWYWQNSDISSKVESMGEKTFGEATFVDATTKISEENSTTNDYFSSTRIERQKSRDKALEELQKVVNSTDENEDARKVAAEKVSSISSYIEIENKIETLVQAKGVKNCVAVVSNDGTKVDVVIDSKELTDDLILQIKEIATEQLNCSFENVTIVQSK